MMLRVCAGGCAGLVLVPRMAILVLGLWQVLVLMPCMAIMCAGHVAVHVVDCSLVLCAETGAASLMVAVQHTS